MRTAESRCLECGAKLNAIGTGDSKTPAHIEPGDFPLCVCIKCGAVMTMDSELRLRGMTDQEMDELQRDQVAMNQLAHMVRNVHLLKGKIN